MRRFLYKQWSITVVDKEYYIESITGEKELLHFETDLECMAYLDRRTKEAKRSGK